MAGQSPEVRYGERCEVCNALFPDVAAGAAPPMTPRRCAKCIQAGAQPVGTP